MKMIFFFKFICTNQSLKLHIEISLCISYKISIVIQHHQALHFIFNLKMFYVCFIVKQRYFKGSKKSLSLSNLKNYQIFHLLSENPCVLVTNILNYDIVVSKFKLQSFYYVPFQTNTLRKAMNLFIPLP